MLQLKDPLIELYGENVLHDAAVIIKDLAVNSNIPFDAKYVELGCRFLRVKANKLTKEKAPSLRVLVSEAFGEAAMYKYNIAGGKL